MNATLRLHLTKNATARTAIRLFSTSSPVAARTTKKQKPSVEEDSEVMTINDAASILRAVEVAAQNSAYELTITTKFTRGQPIPRGKVSLPRDARAKPETVIVFASGKMAAAARAAGAHFVGGEELIPDVLNSAIVPTKVICTPTLLPTITPKLGRFLGPKGLMPAEKRGTVTTNVIAAVKQAQGTMNWKSDRLGVIRAPVGRIHWPIDDVVSNVKAFMAAVKEGTTKEDREGGLGKKRPSSVLQVFLSSTRGPGIRLSDAA